MKTPWTNNCFFNVLVLCMQLSVKARHKHRSPQTMSKNSSTRTNKAVNHVEQSERTDGVSEVASMGYLDPKQRSTDDATEDHRGANVS